MGLLILAQDSVPG